MADLYFDLDGPIVDVSARYYDLYVSLLAESQCTPLERREYWDLKRERVAEERILARTGAKVADYAARRLAVIETEAWLRVDTVHPWALSVLGDLATRHRLTLVTLRSRPDLLATELKRLGIDGYWDDVLVADGRQTAEAGSGQLKEVLIRALDTFDPLQSVIVGDTEGDILAGHRLAIHTVAVLSGIRSEAYLRSLSPCLVAEHLGAVPWDRFEAMVPECPGDACAVVARAAAPVQPHDVGHV